MPAQFDGIVDKAEVERFVEDKLQAFGAGRNKVLAVTSIVFVEVAATGFSCSQLMTITDNERELRS